MSKDRRLVLQSFFSTLFRMEEDGYVEIRPFRPDGKLVHRKRAFLPAGDSASLAECVLSFGRKYHTYFGVCTRTEEGKRARRGTHVHLRAATAMWADLDAKRFGNMTKACNALHRFSLKPSILVFTGNGYHAYWLLEEAIFLDAPERTILQAALKALQVRVLRSDDVSDPARVLRCPYSYNLKNPRSPILAKVISLQEHRYCLDSLLGALPWTGMLPPVSTARAGLIEERYTGLDEVMKSDFITFCKTHAKTLSEPLWYAMITNLIRFRGGRWAIHRLSEPHPDYSFVRTEDKIAHALRDAPGPHSYRYIADHGFESDDLDDPDLVSPASRAFIRREKDGILTPDQASDCT